MIIFSQTTDETRRVNDETRLLPNAARPGSGDIFASRLSAP
jgi:hypothetical protein